MPGSEPGLFAELKRRNVFRVAAMYAVAAWLVVQIADATFEPLGVPEAAHRILILVAAPFAILALNMVKRRAAGLDYDVASDSVDVTTATVNEILDEKGWELAGEYKRWYDLVRSETLADIAAKRDPAENVTLVRIPTEAQYIIPIPFAAISSSNLAQNPEGFKIQ